MRFTIFNRPCANYQKNFKLRISCTLRRKKMSFKGMTLKILFLMKEKFADFSVSRNDIFREPLHKKKANGNE